MILWSGTVVLRCGGSSDVGEKKSMWTMQPQTYKREWLPAGDEPFRISICAIDRSIPLLDRPPAKLRVRVAGQDWRKLAIESRTVTLHMPASFFTTRNLCRLLRQQREARNWIIVTTTSVQILIEVMVRSSRRTIAAVSDCGSAGLLDPSKVFQV